MAQVRTVVEIMLKSNEPRSAFAHDRYWTVVMANAAFVRFLTIGLGQDPPGLVPFQVSSSPHVNILRLLFDPNGFRKVIVNWEANAKALLQEAYRRVAWARESLFRLVEALEPRNVA